MRLRLEAEGWRLETGGLWLKLEIGGWRLKL